MTHFTVQQRLKMTLQINYTSTNFFFLKEGTSPGDTLTKHLGGLTTEMCFLAVRRPEAKVAGLAGWLLLKPEEEQPAPGRSPSSLRPQLS